MLRKRERTLYLKKTGPGDGHEREKDRQADAVTGSRKRCMISGRRRLIADVTPSKLHTEDSPPPQSDVYTAPRPELWKHSISPIIYPHAVFCSLCRTSTRVIDAE